MSLLDHQRRTYERHYARREALVREQLEHPLFADFYDRLAARLLDLAPGPRVRVLEVGCGEGLLAAALHRVAGSRAVELDYTGSDLASAATDLAARLVPGRFVAGDATAVASAQPEARFDLVIAKNLLHHLADPSQLLAAAAPLRATGGRLVAVEAGWGSPQAWLFSLLAPRRERYFFVARQARNRRAFARAGLTLQRVETFSWLPFELAFAIRFGVLRRWLGRDDERFRAAVARVDRRLTRLLPGLCSYRLYVA